MWKMRTKKEGIKVREGTKYCLYCLQTGDNIGRYPCKCNDGGTHRIKIKGTKRYRVRDPKDGYVYLLYSVPKGYELVETITY